MDLNLVGQAAALITSCLWTFNTLFFTEAGRRVGSLSVSAYRIAMAFALLCVTHTALLGNPVPNASSGQWLWIGISGIVGLGIGDFGLFAALILIGPRRSVLVMALSPIFTSITAFLMLGENLSLLSIVGISVTLTGVVLVILERKQQNSENLVSEGPKAWGIFLALVGAMGQGLGLTFAKKGIYYEAGVLLNPLSATMIRMICGALFVWVLIIIAGRRGDLQRALNDRKAMKYTAAGAFVGPFLGVTLSTVAATYAQTGVAQTLMSLMPVFIIPVVWILYREKTSPRGVLGALVAVIGVALLFLI